MRRMVMIFDSPFLSSDDAAGDVAAVVAALADAGNDDDDNADGAGGGGGSTLESKTRKSEEKSGVSASIEGAAVEAIFSRTVRISQGCCALWFGTARC